MSSWSPSSWKSANVAQQVVYHDQERAEEIIAQISQLPPLVTSWEIEELKSKLARAARGELFLLQGGDCAESFADCSGDKIVVTIKILLQMSLVLAHGAGKPVLRV